jgi:hypothetical protein
MPAQWRRRINVVRDPGRYVNGCEPRSRQSWRCSPAIPYLLCASIGVALGIGIFFGVARHDLYLSFVFGVGVTALVADVWTQRKRSADS